MISEWWRLRNVLPRVEATLPPHAAARAGTPVLGFEA